MVYLKHFRLYRKPFDLTPNRELYFPETHQKVLAAVTYALQRGDGVLKVTGEVGTGKTLLCRILLQHLVERDRAEVAFITAPQSDPEALTAAVLREFNLTPVAGGDPFSQLHKHLLEVHAAGKRALLLVDEAQALDRRGLETMRLLSNLETDEAKLLQIVLFGQPELDQILTQHGMRQLSQRIAFNFATERFDRAAAARYIQHRVDRSTDAPSPHRIFSPAAIRSIAAEARGIPRIINILADRALLAAYADNADQVERRHVRAGVEEGILWPRPPGLFGRLAALWR